MHNDMKNALWRQFGAAIDMLENAITACPPKVWGDRKEFTAFWYIAYHTLWWLDYYASDSVENFAPLPPYGIEELDPAGLFPPRAYSKDELLAYLAYGREKYRARIAALSEETARALHPAFGKREFSTWEGLIYVLRHVQHHAAQLNLLLRQSVNDAPHWVDRGKMPLLK